MCLLNDVMSSSLRYMSVTFILDSSFACGFFMLSSFVQVSQFFFSLYLEGIEIGLPAPGSYWVRVLVRLKRFCFIKK